jgi:hypothetical protein
MVAMEHNNQSSRSRLGEQSPAALFSIVPRLGHPRRHQLPRPLLPRAPDTVGSESQNLLDLAGLSCSTPRHWRSIEAGVAFAFPPAALPAFGKPVSVQTHIILGSGSLADATRNRSPRFTVLPRPTQRRNCCSLPALGSRPSPRNGVGNL